MIRYKGVLYPLTKHHQGFLHNADTDVEQIKSNLATIILTEPGERVMNPVFGAQLTTVNLNQPREIVIKNFRDKVATAIKRWEKRVQVDEIKVDLQVIKDEILGNELMIMVGVHFIDPVKLNDIQTVYVQKSLGGVNGRNLPF